MGLAGNEAHNLMHLLLTHFPDGLSLQVIHTRGMDPCGFAAASAELLHWLWSCNLIGVVLVASNYSVSVSPTTADSTTRVLLDSFERDTSTI